MTLQWLLPRLALAALFLFGAAFTFFESVYLRDQFREFRAGRGADPAKSIAGWMWAFRAIAAVLSISILGVIAVW